MRLETAIRGARPSDLLNLHAVIERAYRGPTARMGWTHEADFFDGKRTPLNMLVKIIADPRQRLLAAWRAETPVGCVAIADRGAGLCDLGQLCVEPHLQASGIGKQLLAAAEKTAEIMFRATRLEMTVIEKRTELIAYYHRRGYQVTGEQREFPFAVDPPLRMIVLQKQLDAGRS